ncbi:MAG: hypothetical protein HY852_13105 [Bradyrhizobium sp.]|uniref:hypothetical protein n=1 Tax=Bradyrhizobium sp. TaxID=376 RepID=UPI0025BC5AB7|nr:hypothetical protein [Bradyrhizobium sp.]MBI5262743.1 hypothetical protein [Bradyrhizobium sp.]
MKVPRIAAAISLVGALSLVPYTPAYSAPLTALSAVAKPAEQAGVVQVHYRGWHGGGWGFGALAAGALIGGALAAATTPYYYGGGPYYGYAGYPAYGYGYGYGYPRYGYAGGYYPGYAYRPFYRRHYIGYRPYWGGYRPYWGHRYGGYHWRRW